jgi:hypothetical protein
MVQFASPEDCPISAVRNDSPEGVVPDADPDVEVEEEDEVGLEDALFEEDGGCREVDDSVFDAATCS